MTIEDRCGREWYPPFALSLSKGFDKLSLSGVKVVNEPAS